MEIDLTRQESREAIFPWFNMSEKSRKATYLATVSRAIRPGELKIYPIPLKYRLPAISVPLRPDDPDVILDLQALIEQAYQGYDFLDYSRCQPFALNDADAKWTDELLRSAGKRS